MKTEEEVKDKKRDSGDLQCNSMQLNATSKYYITLA